MGSDAARNPAGGALSNAGSMNATSPSSQITAAGAVAGDTAGLSRRRFLRNAGAAAIAAAAFPTLIPARALGRDAGVAAPSNRTALGVIGMQQGWDGFWKCVDRRKEVVEAVALCDVDAQKLNGRLNETRKRPNGKSAKGWRDFREMFEKAGLDAVVLGAPDHWHGIMGVAAARKGIHIYGEKPLAHTLKEGRAIVDAVAQHGVTWQTGSWQRSVPNFRRAVELVRNGRIGKLVRMEVGTLGDFGTPKRGVPADYGKPPAHLDYDMWVGPAQFTPYDSRRLHWNWRWVLNTGGGNLMDWVGHHVDIAQWGANKDHTGPVKIRPIKAQFGETIYDAERTYEYECVYADGLVMRVNSGNGTKFIGDTGKWIFVTRGKLSASDPAILNEVIGAEEFHLPPFSNHWTAFIDCLRTGGKTIAPAATAHRSASVGHLGHIALTRNKTIEWDPEKEVITNDEQGNAMLYPSFRAPWTL
ncbi:MAG: Gfo/Idh/MocA family oxidoreductase [Puniceicoccales bacterium]|nr:Gfo/Idh/MocA family oxidoreductase [Puniceicoccales bacterium]